MSLRHSVSELFDVKFQIRATVRCPNCGHLPKGHPGHCKVCCDKGRIGVSQGINIQELRELLLGVSHE